MPYSVRVFNVEIHIVICILSGFYVSVAAELRAAYDCFFTRVPAVVLGIGQRFYYFFRVVTAGRVYIEIIVIAFKAGVFA